MFLKLDLDPLLGLGVGLHLDHAADSDGGAALHGFVQEMEVGALPEPPLVLKGDLDDVSGVEPSLRWEPPLLDENLCELHAGGEREKLREASLEAVHYVAEDERDRRCGLRIGQAAMHQLGGNLTITLVRSFPEEALEELAARMVLDGTDRARERVAEDPERIGRRNEDHAASERESDRRLDVFTKGLTQEPEVRLFREGS